MEPNIEPPHHLRWRVSDRTFLVLSLVVIVLTWTLLIVAYPYLPTSIPGYFGFNGRPDAMVDRTWRAAFFPGLLQLVLTAVTWWVSRHPQYSNLPTRVRLHDLPESTQVRVKQLLAHLLIMTGLIANLILAEIALAIVRIGLGLTERLNTVAILGLVVLLLTLVTGYSVWISRHVRRSTVTPTA